MNRASLVIFDCDGVLVDSERISHRVLHGLLAESGIHLTMDDTIDRFIGTSTEGFVRLVDELHGGRTPDGFVERFRSRRHTAFVESLIPVPGIVDVLDGLSSRGTPFCVASNGTHEKTAFSLLHTGLLPRFEGSIFTAGDVAHPKPAPDLFLHAAASVPASPEACVVVEDTPTGIRAARAAGMRALGYAAMTARQKLIDAGAHVVFERMADLPSLLS